MWPCIGDSSAEKGEQHPFISYIQEIDLQKQIETALEKKRKERLYLGQGIYNIEEMPKILTDCQQLTKLYLQNNKISKVPADLRMANLTHISLSHNKLEVFPMALTSLPGLKWINLSGNTIPEVPSQISNLISLEVFWCNNSKLIKIADEIAKCRALVTLGLRGNSIEFVPELSDLTNLKWLTLENNCIETISLSGLYNLIHFNAKNNRIRQIPDMVTDSKSSLKYVYLSSNDIQEVQLVDFYKSKNLKILDLNENPFPDESILPMLKLFPHVVYLSQDKCDSSSETEGNTSESSDEEEDWEYSVETSDLDSSDSDCDDLHEFDDLPETLSKLSKYVSV